VEARVDRAAVEAFVGMKVHTLALYEQALRHRSLVRGRQEGHLASNERLEFLGDAVLGFITAEHLYGRFPDKDEGFLTRLRAKLVNGVALAEWASQAGLGHLILMSDTMAQTAGHGHQTIRADAFEAIIGALYLDLGMPATRQFIHRTVLQPIDLETLAHQDDNHKSLLLEYVQARGWPQPVYRVAAEEGPSHNRHFTVEVLLQKTAYGVGQARSKKVAEQEAARQALARLAQSSGAESPERP
jgi:ribonuclease-3